MLLPGRYVGAETAEAETAKLAEQFSESARLEAEIRANLKGLSYEI